MQYFFYYLFMLLVSFLSTLYIFVYTYFLLIFNNLSVKSRTREIIGKFLSIYIKVFYVYPNYIIRNFSVFINKILDILNNAIHSKLLDHKYLFVALFSALILEEEFKKIGKKIIIVSISKEDKTFYIHKNIIIDENTTIDNYLEKIKNSIQAFYESGYPITTFNILQVKL